MKTINVEGLPEPVAQALQAVVETMRRQLGEPCQGEQSQRVPLLTRPGKVVGPLNRAEIYRDIG